MGIARPRRLVALAAIAVLAASSLGFAASNTVGASQAGDGTGTISGYNIDRVRYRLRPANPGILNAVVFRLDAPAQTVRAQLWPGGPWLSCRNTTGRNWRCPGTGSANAPVTQLAGLRVVATD
ncbi:MAG: hypothetical protein M9925_04950 [Chloroflexi bacterium]|jgi:hypothetical protein|nr:hypothetical protein [Dehalococcoidia bacterium]MCO5201032.1 hypothetical protein [Chloroflexota bacterium]NJD64845.1 hypothetical protein [Chloroflexota bacterium]PWB48105.1 MAG: hypothetical protein C3F10_01660 [Dehalococcoidia bacterium]